MKSKLYEFEIKVFEISKVECTDSHIKVTCVANLPSSFCRLSRWGSTVKEKNLLP